jgi:hypothetical protein
MAKSLENMLKRERKPCVRELRDGKPFKDIGKWIYLKQYCTAICQHAYEKRTVGNWYLFLFKLSARRKAVDSEFCGCSPNRVA